MSLYLLLDAVLWIFGIRDHIPRNGDFHAGRSESPPGAGSDPLLWVLAAFVVTVVLLSLTLWAAVWLAIKLP